MKGKLGKIMYRRIGGRVVPIRIHNVADQISEASMPYAKFRKIVAKTDKGEVLGTMSLTIPKKGKHAQIAGVEVRKEMRKRGISKNLMARAKQFLERANVGFLRSRDVQHVAQAKLRRGMGRYKAGEKYKSRTKFFTDQAGPFGEKSRRVSRQEAIDIIKENQTPRSTGKQVWTTTMLKKLKGRKK